MINPPNPKFEGKRTEFRVINALLELEIFIQCHKEGGVQYAYAFFNSSVINYQ